MRVYYGDAAYFIQTNAQTRALERAREARVISVSCFITNRF